MAATLQRKLLAQIILYIGNEIQYTQQLADGNVQYYVYAVYMRMPM